MFSHKMMKKYFFLFYSKIFFLSTTFYLSEPQTFRIHDALNKKVKIPPKSLESDHKCSSKVIKPNQIDQRKQI